MNQVLSTSITITILKHSYGLYRFIKQRVIDIYSNSQTDRLIKVFGKKIKICFQYSFLGKISDISDISDIREGGNRVILDNSRSAQPLINFYKKQKDKINNSLNTSKAAGLTKVIKERLYILPVKTLSIIMLTAIAINLALTIILQKTISLWGWILCGLLSFIGISGLFCNVDWLTLKNSSNIFKLENNAKN